MRILVDVDDAGERFEELIELVVRGDEVFICRAGKPVVEITGIPKGMSKPGELKALMDEGRASVLAGTTSHHDDFYDEHGLPK